jgi:hypothetical protein
MGYLYKGDAILKGNLLVKSKKPLDSRSIVQNVDELYTIDVSTAYEGMPIVSIDEATIYLLIDESNIGNKKGWKAITSVNINPDSGEIDLSDYVTLTALQEALADYDLKVDNQIKEALQTYDATVEEKINAKVEEAVSNLDIPKADIILEEEVTSDSENAVKSKGIFNAITNMLDAKFVVLSEEEYKAMESHDATTFYFIKQ